MYSDIDEMVELARVCGAVGGVYTTHMRGDGAGLLAAVAEAIEVARRSGVQLNLSHLKVMGKANHGKVKDALAMMDAAVSEGLRVTADCYPYDASCTTMTVSYTHLRACSFRDFCLAKPGLFGQGFPGDYH